MSKASDLEPHVNDIVESVHRMLVAKGVKGFRLTKMHFASDSGGTGQCPDGFTFKCVNVPPNGLHCECVPNG